MAIVINPNYTPNSAYRPNQFITAQIYAPAPVEWAYVELTVNGSTLAPFAVPLYLEDPANTYQFKFDLQTLLQQYVAPFSTAITPIFGTINAPHALQVPELTVDYSVEVTYKYRDPSTGLLVSLGATDTSSNYYAVTGTRQHEQAMSFANYKPNASSPNTRLWLTDAPTSVPVSNSENLWLCHFADAAADTYRIKTYSANGTLIDTGDFAADTDANEVYINSVGVGIANLATQVYSSGAVTLPNPNVAYYTIQLFNSAVPFIDFLEPRTFTVVENCDNSIRLHWLNLLGGSDAYTFKKLQRKTNATSYTTAIKPLNWSQTLTPHSLSDKGAYKLQSTTTVQYEADSEPLTPDEADWLKQLALSPETYRETSAGLVPVVVTLQEIPIEKEVNSELNLVVIRITFTDANTIITQHN